MRKETGVYDLDAPDVTVHIRPLVRDFETVSANAGDGAAGMWEAVTFDIDNYGTDYVALYQASGELFYAPLKEAQMGHYASVATVSDSDPNHRPSVHFTDSTHVKVIYLNTSRQLVYKTYSTQDWSVTDSGAIQDSVKDGYVAVAETDQGIHIYEMDGNRPMLNGVYLPVPPVHWPAPELVTWFDAASIGGTDYVFLCVDGKRTSLVKMWPRFGISDPQPLFVNDYHLFGDASMLVPFVDHEGKNITVLKITGTTTSLGVSSGTIHTTIAGSILSNGRFSAPMSNVIDSAALIGQIITGVEDGRRFLVLLHPSYSYVGSVVDDICLPPEDVSDFTYQETISFQPTVITFYADLSTLPEPYSPELGDAVELKTQGQVWFRGVLYASETDAIVGARDVHMVVHGPIENMRQHSNFHDIIWGSNIIRKSYRSMVVPFGATKGLWKSTADTLYAYRMKDAYGDDETAELLLYSVVPTAGWTLTVDFYHRGADKLLIHFGDIYAGVDISGDVLVIYDGVQEQTYALGFSVEESVDEILPYRLVISYSGFIDVVFGPRSALVSYDASKLKRVTIQDFATTVQFSTITDLTLEAHLDDVTDRLYIAGVDLYSWEAEHTMSDVLEEIAGVAGVPLQVYRRVGTYDYYADDQTDHGWKVYDNHAYSAKIDEPAVGDMIVVQSVTTGTKVAAQYNNDHISILKDDVEIWQAPILTQNPQSLRIVGTDKGGVVLLGESVITIHRALGVQHTSGVWIAAKHSDGSNMEVTIDELPVAAGAFVWDVAVSAYDAFHNITQSLRLRTVRMVDGTIRVRLDSPYASDIDDSWDHSSQFPCITSPVTGHYASQIASGVIMYCADVWVSYLNPELLHIIGGATYVKAKQPYVVGRTDCLAEARRYAALMQSKADMRQFKEQQLTWLIQPGDIHLDAAGGTIQKKYLVAKVVVRAGVMDILEFPLIDFAPAIGDYAEEGNEQGTDAIYDKTVWS